MTTEGETPMTGTETTMWAGIAGFTFLMWLLSGSPWAALVALGAGMSAAWGMQRR